MGYLGIKEDPPFWKMKMRNEKMGVKKKEHRGKYNVVIPTVACGNAVCRWAGAVSTTKEAFDRPTDQQNEQLSY